MNLRKNIGLVLAALIVGASIPTLASSSTGTRITACVDWVTKEIKYSKSWTKCPAKTSPIVLGATGPQGPAGPAGPQGIQGLPGPAGASGVLVRTSEKSYPWGSESTCLQQLNSALAAGYNMAFKTDRQTFERDTGCVVEEIYDSNLRNKFVNAGFPALVEWEFVDLVGGEGSDISLANGTESLVWVNYDVIYRVKIENDDAVSPTNFLGYCTHRGGLMNDLGNGVYEGTFGLEADLTGIGFALEVGFWTRYGCNLSYEAPWRRGLQQFMFPDPELLKEQGFVDTFIEFWGW